MYQCKAVRTILTATFLILVASAAQATPDYLTRPGTVAHALLQTDGSCVSLDAVKVDKIKARQNPAYFVIVEDWDSTKRLIVDMAPPEVLRMGQTVDVEGEMETLSSGERAITSVRVMGYCDRNGVLLRYSPLMKGMLEPAPWPYKMELTAPLSRSRSAETELVPGEPSSEPLPPPTVYSTIADFLAAAPDEGSAAQLGCKPILSTGSDPTYGAYIIMGEDGSSETLKVYCPTVPSSGARLYDVMGQVRPEGNDQVICTTSGPDYDPQSYEGYASPAADGTIAYVKTVASGTAISLPGKVVTEVFYSPGTQTLQFFYIQEQPGALGSDGKRHDYSAIKVTWTGAAFRPGDVVSIIGHVYGAPTYAECYISASSVTKTATAAIPPPVGMSQKTTAGGQFGLQPALYVNGTSSWILGSGLDHVGLLTKIWGKLLSGEGTDGGPYTYYLDDGSGLAAYQSDGQTQYSGLKVICSTAAAVDGWKTGDMIGVTGSLGAELSGTYPVPVLRTDLAAPIVVDEGTHTASSSQLYVDCSPVNADSEISYKYAIGTTSGGTNVRGWTSAPGGASILATGLALAAGNTYYVSVKAINGAGLASPVATTDGITVDSGSPQIGTISDNSADYSGGEIPQYEKYQASFTIQTKGESSPGSMVFAGDPNGYNPFSPRLEAYDYYSAHAWAGWPGLYVDAIITKPNGQQIRWPCFYDYSRGWKFRFAPTETGLWSYEIEVRHRPGEIQNGQRVDGSITYTVMSPSKSFTCVNNTTGWSKHGFVRVDSNDCRFFSFSEANYASATDDTVFYPFGVKCGSTTDIDSLSSEGGTYSRLFAASRMFEQQYTGTQPDAGDRVNDFRNTGYTNLSRDADWWDTFIERAREKGVYLLYLVNDWTRWHDPNENPYLVEGVADTLANTFAADSSTLHTREVYKRKLRWLMARWGYATSIIGFDLINECQASDGTAQSFHNDMADFITGGASAPASWPVTDDYFGEQPHLVTGSLSSDHYSHSESVNWTYNRIGMGNLHSYARTNYNNGNPFYGNMVTDNPPNGLDWLGSQLTYLWQDSAVWADRAVRMHRRSGFTKPFSWTEFGCAPPSLSGDWTAAYQGDTTAQHAKDWVWGLLMTGGSGSHWLPGYFNGGFNGGTPLWSIFKPLSNYLGGVDFRGMTQESSYRNADETNADSTLNPNPHVISSNHLVGVYCMRGSDKAYVYAKNLTNTWYHSAGFSDLSVPTPASQSANITIKGLQASATYTIDRWSTTDPTDQVKGNITHTTNGSGDLVFPVNWDSGGNAISIGATTDYDWAYKVYR